MPPRMITVRHKETGDVRQLGESAFPYYTSIYERVDEPAPDQPASAGEPAPSPGESTGSGRATTTPKKKEA
ncbi:hypothetical protein ACIBH1_05475 [Nonomuraea sp. NPDC050663]|uniref:hypothetical protein n=1 Tax=Nonomuraea sp. NPDC050663 TaxID=3364370 RepID=UPI0037AD0D94